MRPPPLLAAPLATLLATLLVATGAHGDETLGRLFTTPAERAALDDARRQKLLPAAPAPEPPPAVPPPQFVTINGVVKRSDGQSTIWVNDKPVRGAQTTDGVTVLGPGPAGDRGSVALKLPESGRDVRIKVGQRLDAVSGQVQERYLVKTAPKPAQPDEVLEQKLSAPDAAARKAARSRRAEDDLLDATSAAAAAAPPPPPPEPPQYRPANEPFFAPPAAPMPRY